MKAQYAIETRYQPLWIEVRTFDRWLNQGCIAVVEHGEENTYAVTEWGQTVYCKR